MILFFVFVIARAPVLPPLLQRLGLDENVAQHGWCDDLDLILETCGRRVM
jgi:hypothetical protein